MKASDTRGRGKQARQAKPMYAGPRSPVRLMQIVEALVEAPQGFSLALLARRLYGKYLAPHAEHLRHRIQELEGGSYKSEIAVLKTTPTDELKKQYAVRQIEE